MVKPTENWSQSIAPFLRKCYEMVDDETTDSIISWSQNNDSFVIWDMTEFSVRLLPHYFKHNNFSSFIRQLNIYGFRKIDTDRWEFANDGFVRGQKDLLKNIARRKYSQGSEQRKTLPQKQDNSVGSGEKDENVKLWNEVENLKTDKHALTLELLKLGQYQETADNKLLLLKERLQGMEKSQQQLLSFLITAMQSPGFLVQLIPQKENNWRMPEANNMLGRVTEDAEQVASDHMIVPYQPLTIGTSKPVLTPIIDSKIPRESDSSSDGKNDFWMDIDFVKALMDDSHTPSIPPELHDYGAWEKLLLANDSPRNNDDKNQDDEGAINTVTCTVELVDINFTGEPAKTKKQAEKNVAIATCAKLGSINKKKKVKVMMNKIKQLCQEFSQALSQKATSNNLEEGVIIAITKQKRRVVNGANY